MLCAMPTQLRKPMAASSTPRSRSQAVKVPPTSSRGSPAEKPRNSMPITRGCRYTAKASRQSRWPWAASDSGVSVISPLQVVTGIAFALVFRRVLLGC
jgi:hypothetical protein